MKKILEVVFFAIISLSLIACGTVASDDNRQKNRKDVAASVDSNNGATGSDLGVQQTEGDIFLDFTFSDQGQTYIRIADEECYKTMITDEDPYGENCYQYQISIFSDDMQLLGSITLSDRNSCCSWNGDFVDADAWKASEDNIQAVFEDGRVEEMLRKAGRYHLEFFPVPNGEIVAYRTDSLVQEGELKLADYSSTAQASFESVARSVYGDDWNEQSPDLEQLEAAILPYYVGTYVCETDHKSTQQADHIYRCELVMPSGYAPGVDGHFFAEEYTGSLRYSNSDLVLCDDGTLSVVARYEILGYGDQDAYLTFFGGNSIHIEFTFDGKTYSETLHPME